MELDIWARLLNNVASSGTHNPSLRCVDFCKSTPLTLCGEKPISARDLFYTVDGVKKRTGFWGLRGFSSAPYEYPIRGMRRAYADLLDRVATPLANVRGIAYRDEIVHAIQVSFAPGSPYPDTLREDGIIEHIGEGRAPLQSNVGGNRGMLEAQRLGYEIPVFQSIGPKNKKRYADLGLYQVVDSTRRALRFGENNYDTDAFVFLLRPAPNGTPLDDHEADLEVRRDNLNSRGGFENPLVRDIATAPPKPASGDAKSTDPEVRRQAADRRVKAHFELVKAFEARAKAAGLECKCD